MRTPFSFAFSHTHTCSLAHYLPASHTHTRSLAHYLPASHTHARSPSPQSRPLSRALSALMPALAPTILPIPSAALCVHCSGTPRPAVCHGGAAFSHTRACSLARCLPSSPAQACSIAHCLPSFANLRALFRPFSSPLSIAALCVHCSRSPRPTVCYGGADAGAVGPEQGSHGLPQAGHGVWV